MKYTYNGREFDVQMIANEKKTSLRLDLGLNLEIRSKFDTVEQVIKEIGEEKANEGFEKAIEAQETERANVYQNRKEFKAFIVKAFEDVQAEKGLDAKLVVKGMSNDYSRVEKDKKTIVINGANEIKSKEFALAELNKQVENYLK